MYKQKYIKHSVCLFDNQKNNVKQLVTKKRALLTDRVGSGKSLSVLYSFGVLKEAGILDNMLVLTPLSAHSKLVWKKDIDKFTNFKCIDVESLYKQSKGSKDKLIKLMCEYHIIYGKHTFCKIYTEFLDLILKSSKCMLCIDEVHAFKNPKSSLTLSLRQITQDKKYFWGISGSSISKSLEDFYNILNLICPWYLGSFSQFLSEYCTTKEKTVGYANGRRRVITVITGISDEAKFREKIKPVVITGESFLQVKFKYIDYELDEYEQSIYSKIAKGINLSPDLDQDSWIRMLLSDNSVVDSAPKIKEIDLFSSRFIYLQSAADGIIDSTGSLIRESSTKLQLLISKLKEITDKGRSAIVYFDFYASLNIVKSLIEKSNIRCKCLESTGSHVLKESDVSEAACKKIPHIILGTKASSESVSYYFINNVIFFQIPTTPSVMTQLVGRITRKNTLYPDDLNCYIFRSNNIDLYKLMLVSSKTYQMELVQGVENNVPCDYKQNLAKTDLLDRAKKYLLWQKFN